MKDLAANHKAASRMPLYPPGYFTKRFDPTQFALRKRFDPTQYALKRGFNPAFDQADDTLGAEFGNFDCLPITYFGFRFLLPGVAELCLGVYEL